MTKPSQRLFLNLIIFKVGGFKFAVYKTTANYRSQLKSVDLIIPFGKSRKIEETLAYRNTQCRSFKMAMRMSTEITTLPPPHYRRLTDVLI